MKLNTNWREATGAFIGAIIGTLIPILLHLLSTRLFGDAEAMGMPIAILSLPGFFIGAIIGASLVRKRDSIKK